MSDQELPARLAIESRYARLGEALCNKDLDALHALHAPDYSERLTTGEERGLEELMAEWRDDFADMIAPRFETEILSFGSDGAEAKVNLRTVLAFSSAPSALRRVSNRIETLRCDCWADSGEGWRLSRAEIQATKYWVDDTLEQETQFEPPLTPDQRACVLRDLGANAFPFASVLAGNGFDDLACLDRLIGDARIVALGEATHGTAEFFQMKHRLIEYLVEKKGFTVVAIEGNWPEAQVADRFVKTGEGEAGAALTAMYYWTWQSQEVAALLHWMHDYNAARGARPLLSFTGFDMQVPNVAIKHVTDFLDRTGSADRDTLRALYDGMEKLDMWGTGTPVEENARFADRAGQALALIEAKREVLVAASTPEEYRGICQAARIVWQAFARRAGIAGMERDRAMAANVAWLIEDAFPGERIVVWAHNSHVGTDMGGGYRTLGNHLRELYGDQMVTIGFAMDHGEVRARLPAEDPSKVGPLASTPLAPVKKVSVEAMFHETGVPRFIVDLRALPADGAARAWLSKPRLHRMVGAVYDAASDSKCYAQVRLTEMYDAVVFIAESTAAKGLK